MYRTKILIYLLSVLCACMILGGFHITGEAAGAGGDASAGKAAGGGGPYTAPEFAVAAFHEDKAEESGNVKVDLSAVSQGYVAVSCTANNRLKFQVIKDDATYNYDMESDGTPAIFPLQCGDGTYEFHVMENVTGTKYAQLYSNTCDVKLSDEFQPFIRPSNYVNYTRESKCVKKAEELAADAGDALGLVQKVYEYVCTSVTYDKAKAKGIQKGYIPDPDETFTSGKGICFDYASMVAAMLRSQGIPTKVIFGYVAPKDLYHAWNMFYTKDTGWVTVKYEVKGNNWNRLDLTFAANGADGDFIGDGTNYTDVSCY